MLGEAIEMRVQIDCLVKNDLLFDNNDSAIAEMFQEE